MPLKWDIDSENFNNYFHILTSGLGENQKELLPKELVYQLYQKGGKPKSQSFFKLPFLAKLFILVKALKKSVTIMVLDENGMDEEQYFKYKKLKRNSSTMEDAKEVLIQADFVLAKKELFETFSSLNFICASKHYTYLTTQKNAPKNKTAQWLKEMRYITRFLAYYESNRKRIHLNTGLNFSEWMVLLKYYDGVEQSGSYLYQEFYRYSFNSSKVKQKLALSSLQDKGYLSKHGMTFGAKYTITELGKVKIVEIMHKYVLNC